MDSTNVTTAPSRRADLLAVALLLLLPLLFAAAMLAAGLALSPVANLFTSYPWQALGADAGAPNAALSDVTQWFHPALLWGAREIRAGRLPLWMPTAYTGVPFFANPQTALLFPLTWLAWILPAGAALTLITVLKLAGAGLATYWFLRVGPGLTVPAALIGSLGFEFSTTLVGWAGWAFGNEIVCLPLLFAGVERVRASGARRWTVALVVIVALTIVAGYPQGAFHALLAAGAWTLVRARGAARGFVVRGVLALLLGAGLAAVQVVPFLEYLRASAVYAYRSQWMAPLSVPPTAAITLALPYAFGSAADAWGPWQFNIASTYVGLVPLLLLPLGVAAGRHRPGGRFFILYMVVVAAVHYGLPGAAQIARLPGLSLGANLRLMPHLDFAVCVLGALGADALARREAAPGGWPVRLAVVVIVLTAFGWVAAHHDLPGARGLAWSLDRQFVLALAGLTLGALLALRWLATGAAAWGAALVALQALSVAPPALAYLPRAPARWLYPEAPAIAWLRAHAGVDRVLMPGHVGPLYGLAEAHGYDGLTPRRVAELVGSVGTGIALVHGYIQNPLEGVGSEALSPVAVLASPVVDLLGVRYVMLPADAAPIWPHLTLAYDGRDARVFVNSHALPRAFLAFRARCAPDAEAVWALRGHRVDARAEALLADCATPPAAGPPSAVAAVGVRAWEPARVRVATDSDAPAVLVLTDTWFPGWRARVDGRPATLWRADHAFRAVAVPAGRHEVELRYQPRSVLIGALVSALAAALTLALLVTGRRREAS